MRALLEYAEPVLLEYIKTANKLRARFPYQDCDNEIEMIAEEIKRLRDELVHLETAKRDVKLRIYTEIAKEIYAGHTRKSPW